MIDRLKHMFGVEHEANRTLLAGLTDDDGDELRIMRHIIQCQFSYLGQWRGEEIGGEGPEVWSLDGCKEREQEAARAWRDHLAGVADADMGWELARETPSGQFRLDVTDMLIHVVTHGFYHRAQIDLMLRQSGREPPRAGYAFLAGYGLVSEDGTD